MIAIHVAIENVSRRSFLRGMLATGGLVIAAEFVPMRGALAYATGAASFPAVSCPIRTSLSRSIPAASSR